MSDEATRSISFDAAQELAQLSGLMLTAPDLISALEKVTQVATAVVPACDGTSLTMREQGMPAAAAANDDWAKELDRLQFEEQEGPCLDCMREGSVMRVRDLAVDGRFPSYGPRAAERGASAALSMPLAAEGRTVGALNLYSRTPDAFGTEQVALATLLAAHASLAVQAAASYFSSAHLATQLQEALSSRAEIEQAKGVLIRERGCSANEAFELLVQASQRENRKLRDVAKEIVRRASGSSSPSS